MDSNLSDLADRVTSLENQLRDIQIMLNNIILIFHISDTDLKNHLHHLD